MDNLIKMLLSEKFAKPVLVILIAYFVYRITKQILSKRISFKNNRIDEKKKKMIKDVINKIIKYFIVIISFLIVLEVFDVDTTGLITSLGVVGLVAGLAVQDLIKDFVAGISIIADGKYQIGDIIKCNDFKGEVIFLDLKTTKIKAYTGEVMIVPNHLIDKVINYSHSKYLSFVDICIAYESDLNKTIEVLTEMCDNNRDKIKGIKGSLSVLGVESLADSSVVIRIAAETNGRDFLNVQRSIKKLAKEALDANNINIPYPQLVVHDGKRI